MKITLSENAGFCPGVKRADKAVHDLLKNKQENEKIYTLGALIHNSLYNDELRDKGVQVISFDDVEKTLLEAPELKHTLIIRTHGITKEQNTALLELSERYSNFKLIDMTCPSVKKIHRIAEDNTSDNTCFLLFCNKEHPEAIGIMSYANGEKHTISSPEDLEKIDLTRKIPILCSQTTENLKLFEKIKKNLKKLCTNAIFFDTICSVTENRQNEAISIARDSLQMIVIGGKDSSNTRKLYELFWCCFPFRKVIFLVRRVFSKIKRILKTNI